MGRPRDAARADRGAGRRPGDRPGARALRRSLDGATGRRPRRGASGRRSDVDGRLDAARARARDGRASPACAAGAAARARRSPRAATPRRIAAIARRAGAAVRGAGSRSTRRRRSCATPASPSCPDGRGRREDAVAAWRELGGAVARQARPGVRAQGRDGGVVLDLDDERRRPRARTRALGGTRARRARWRRAGLELLVAVRRDGARARCSWSALGGVHTEPLDDVAVVPLPADAGAHRARRSHDARALPTAARRRSPRGSPTAAARRSPLALIELNPVIVHRTRRRGRRRAGRPGGPDMNEIAAKLGEVGLPAPITELAAERLGRGRRRRRPQRPDRRRLPRHARASQVLVLERRERLGGACTLERPFPDERYQRQPVRVRRRPARRARDRRAAPAPARLRVLRRRPQPVGPVRGRHELRPVARRRPDPAQPRGARGLQARTSRATGPTSTSSTRSASGLRTRGARHLARRDARRARRSRSCCTASRR